MKKVLALALAVMMLTSLAFAAVGDACPGAKIKMNQSGYSAGLNNGESLIFWLDDDDYDAPTKAITTENYSISKVDYEEGKKYIDSVYIDDDDKVLVVKLKQDYTLTDENEASISLEVRLRQKGKSIYCIAKIGWYSHAPETSRPLNVYYDTANLTINPDRKVTFVNGDLAKDTLYTVTDPEDKAYGTFEYDFGSDEQYGVSVRVYEDEELFLEISEDADKDILKANADADADYIDFVEWVAHPTFTSNVTLEFYGAEEDDYIYEIKDGKLVTPSRLKWDDDAEVWTLTTRTLGAYVVSDVKLAKAVAEGDADVGNPDTGANDVVGIAGALAVVAMISAAAVSLKK